jgi:hypothetical protein
VGFLASLRPGLGAAELTAAASLVDPYLMPVALGSPWAPTSHLASVIVEDLLGAAAPRALTRAEAMRIPAVARARHIIAGTLARIPLRAYPGESTDPLTGDRAPSWLSRTDGPISPFHRMLMTVDDLLFYNWSLWRITERTADERLPLRMARVPMEQWQFEAGTGRVLTLQPDGSGGWAWKVTPDRDVVLIPGGTGGLLDDGQDTLGHARDLEASAHNAARFPTAYIGLEQTSGPTLKRRSDDPAEVTVETIVNDWRAARRNPEGGGVAWLGGVKPHELGAFDKHLLESGRNAAAVDVARHTSIPADLIDATVTESSLHYSTSRDNDRRFIDYGLGLYMSAISARLSQDDVTPRGQRIAFDLEQWLKGSAPAPGQAPADGAPGLSTSPDTQEPPQ